jgi:hypothetical protein
MHISFRMSEVGGKAQGAYKVPFTRAQQDTVERLKEAIEKQRSIAISAMLAPRRNRSGSQI